MVKTKSLSCMTVAEIITKAICTERHLMRYYQDALPEVGRAARLLMATLYS